MSEPTEPNQPRNGRRPGTPKPIASLRRFFPGPSPGGDAAPSEISVSEEGRIKSGKLAGLSMWHAIWILAGPVLIDSFLLTTIALASLKLR